MTFQPFPFVQSMSRDIPYEDAGCCSHKDPILADNVNYQALLLAITEPVELDLEPTSLDLSPIFETPGLSCASPSVIFGSSGYFLIQLRLPLSTGCHVEQSILFVTPATTGNILIWPENYMSSPLSPELDHIMQVYYFLVFVQTSGASVLINVNLNTTAPCSQAWLGHGRLVAYRLP